MAGDPRSVGPNQIAPISTGPFAHIVGPLIAQELLIEPSNRFPVIHEELADGISKILDDRGRTMRIIPDKIDVALAAMHDTTYLLWQLLLDYGDLVPDMDCGSFDPWEFLVIEDREEDLIGHGIDRCLLETGAIVKILQLCVEAEVICDLNLVAPNLKERIIEGLRSGRFSRWPSVAKAMQAALDERVHCGAEVRAAVCDAIARPIVRTLTGLWGEHR